MTTLPNLSPLNLAELDFERLLGDPRLGQQIRFILEVEKLKTVLRRTPLLNASRVENDAEHTWELALMAVVLAEYADETVDLCKVLKRWLGLSEQFRAFR